MEQKEYIDRVAFRRKLIDEKGVYPACVSRALYEMPAEDVVEVVRCRDCVKWTVYENTEGAGYCHNRNFCFRYDSTAEREFTPITMPDDYCSYGERKGQARNTVATARGASTVIYSIVPVTEKR